jgi:hypothetical protein
MYRLFYFRGDSSDGEFLKLRKGGFMFVETYFDERAPVSASTREPVIPYPQLLGEALTVWQKYLPIRRPIEDLPSWRFEAERVPGSAIREIERAKNATGLFDRVEIWRRTGDPMAVGVIAGQEPRYFSIVRWGDAEINVEEAKERLRAEKRVVWMAAAMGLLGLLFVVLVAIAQSGR